MTGHERWDELAAGYALHGLAPDEEIAFSDHLETCTQCTASVTEHELVAAQLGSIAHFHETDQAPSWESMHAAILTPRPDAPPVVNLAGRRHRYDLSRRVLAAAAAVAVVAGGGIATWQLTTGGGTARCATSTGCHAIALDAAGRNEASLVVRNTDVTLTSSAMPAARAGMTYVLWQLPRDGHATPITEFNAGPGTTPTTGRLSQAYTDTAAFAISEENAAKPPPSTPSNTLASGTAT
jgi:Anti-sigma-K factor rskA